MQRAEVNCELTEPSITTAAGETPAGDAQRGKALGTQILDFGAERAQGVDKRGYGTRMHALSSPQGHRAARCGGIVGRQEAHGGAPRADIYVRGGGVGESRAYGACVVTVGHVGRERRAGGEGCENQRAGAHALGEGHREARLHEVFGWKYAVVHDGWLFGMDVGEHYL